MKKRLGFKFLRSYYEVYMHLKTKKDKLEFMEAIISCQFLDTKTNDIVMSSDAGKLAFVSIKHSLDASILGFVTKYRGYRDLGVWSEEVLHPLSHPPEPEVKVKEKEKVKEKVKEQYVEREKDDFINSLKIDYVGIPFEVGTTSYYFAKDGFLKENNSDTKINASLARTIYNRISNNRDAILAHLEHNKGE